MDDLDLSISHVPAQPGEIRGDTIGGLLRAAAADDPDAPCLTEVDIDGRCGQRWTRGALLRDVERLALALASRFDAGERVCIWAPNMPEWVMMEYACSLAGLVLVTANPAYQADELAYVLKQSRAVALFQVASYRGNPMAEIGRQAAAKVPAIREIVDLTDHAALFATGDRPGTLPEVDPASAAMIQYTSGTTGFPKGAVLPHRAVTNNARFFVTRTGIGPGDRWLGFMPLFHTAGCGMAVLGSIQAGAEYLTMPVFDVPQVLRLIEEERVTAFTAVPTMLFALLEHLEHQPADLSGVDVIVVGGSMVAPDLARRVIETFGCAFQVVYGQTETAPLITQHRRAETLEDICTTIGPVLPAKEVSIRHVRTNDPVPIGETGEICVRGYCNMLGYNDNPEATAATIDPEGWLHTGDLGTMDTRGYLTINGRVKEMIIRGGENLFPAEIENCLLEHPDIAEVAVVGLPDDKWGEIVAAFVRTEDGTPPDVAALRAHCRQRLAPMKTPVAWFSVAEYPMTGSGKVRKFALREGVETGAYTPLS